MKENQIQDEDIEYRQEWGVKLMEKSSDSLLKNTPPVPAWGVKIRQDVTPENPIGPMSSENFEQPITAKATKYDGTLSKYFESPSLDSEYEDERIPDVSPDREFAEWAKLTDKAKPFLEEKFTQMYNKLNAIEMSSIPPEPPQEKLDVQIKPIDDTQLTDGNPDTDFLDESLTGLDSTNTNVDADSIDTKKL